MFRVTVLVCAFGLLGLSAGQIVQSGQCNADIAVAANFDVEQVSFLRFDIVS